MRTLKAIIWMAMFLVLATAAMIGTYAAIRGPADYHTEVDKAFRAVTAPYWEWRQSVMDGEAEAARLRSERERLAAINAAKPHARDLSSAEREIVEAAVRRELRDPASAVFQHTKIFTSNAPYKYSGKYCLLVNAKNGFGGYAGNEPFMLSISDSGKVDYAFVSKFGDDADGFCASYIGDVLGAVQE